LGYDSFRISFGGNMKKYQEYQQLELTISLPLEIPICAESEKKAELQRGVIVMQIHGEEKKED
jgi:hypothetical protein